MKWIALVMVSLSPAISGCGPEPEVLVVSDCDDCARPPTVSGVCVGNNDGAIAASELPVLAGTRVAYLANAEAPVAVDLDSWDFMDGPTELAQVLEIVSADGAWWAAESFPTATHATPVDLKTPDVLAVFRVEDSRMLLLGLTSAAPPPEQALTRLIYDEPVVLYDFPLTLGKEWSQTARFKDARLFGAINAGADAYRFVIDAQGTASLPDFTLQNTLRLRVELTRTLAIGLGGNTSTLIQLSYLHECVGEITRIVSLPGETSLDFTEASEYRRLGLR